jgi:chromosome segregation ATPase
MTNEEKLELVELMRQAIREEVPQIVREQTADLRADVGTLKTDVAALKADVTELKRKATEFEQELQSITENVKYIIDVTAREFREVKARLDALEGRAASLDRRFGSLENQMKWATDAILDLRADLKKHQQDHQQYPTMEELLKLESRIDRLEAQLVKLLENN